MINKKFIKVKEKTANSKYFTLRAERLNILRVLNSTKKALGLQICRLESERSYLTFK